MPKTHTFTTWTIEEHANPDACYEWIRNNWHDLGQGDIEEALESAKALGKLIGLKTDWSISIHPDRGEFIRWRGDVAKDVLAKDYITCSLEGNCPLTGTWADECLLDAMRENPSGSLDEFLRESSDKLLSAVHKQGEYIYSDEGLKKMAIANEYDFKECGEVV